MKFSIKSLLVATAFFALIISNIILTVRLNKIEKSLTSIDARISNVLITTNAAWRYFNRRLDKIVYPKSTPNEYSILDESLPPLN